MIHRLDLLRLLERPHRRQHDRQGVFLVLVGFILSFAFIRMSTRLMRSPKVPWWPGSVVSESGVHLHHLVFGIVTMMIAGTLGFAAHGDSPCAEICGFLFGVGAGLTIDEFALWVYLDDVYWAEEGRSSIDATVIAAGGDGAGRDRRQPARHRHRAREGWLARHRPRAPAALHRGRDLLLQGPAPARDRSASSSSRSRSTAPAGSASRARPGRGGATASGSPKKQAKAEERFPPDRRTERFKNAFRDIVGGKPSEGVAAARDEAIAATREATEEVRHRAEQVTHAGDRDTSATTRTELSGRGGARGWREPPATRRR